MKTKIKVDTIESLIQFWITCETFKDDVFVTQNGRVMDAKSILGLCSLNLLEPFEIRYLNDDFYQSIQRWEIIEKES